MNMYKQISLCLLLIFCSQFTLADWIDDAAKNTESHAIKLRQHIHQHPELGNIKIKLPEPLFLCFSLQKKAELISTTSPKATKSVPEK